MALLQRVSTLLRANLNDLIDRAENPEKMLKQVILDMENQFIQVKTQVALALADLHLLEKKKRDHESKHGEWMRKAELAVSKNEESLARVALRHALTDQPLSENYETQIAEQEHQVEYLKSALRQLETKLQEARAKVDMLIVRDRRSRGSRRAATAQQDPQGGDRILDRMSAKVTRNEVFGQAIAEMAFDDAYDRLGALERDQKIDLLLDELKSRLGQ